MACSKTHSRMPGGAPWPLLVAALLLARGCIEFEEPVLPNSDGTVSTVAGTGVAGQSGDGGLSRLAQIDTPMDVAATDDGRLLIADFNNHRVRQVDLATGTVTTVAGDGTPAGGGAVAGPTGVRPLADGEFLVVSWNGHRVFRYAADGTRAAVAGSGGDECSAPDDPAGPADRPMHAPRSVDVLADGSLLISEQGCHRVWRVRNDGTVTLYAGTGEAGYSGDNADAVLARLQADDVAGGPCFGLSLSPEDPPDELFIADTANHVVRVVKPFTGRIETFAGDGEAGFVDGPPEQARFNRPTHVFCARDHSVWIVDSGNHAIRYVDPLNTRVETLVGAGVAGFNGDGRAPGDTLLNNPTSVWATPEGVVFVADAGNHRVRMFLRP